MDTVYSHRLGAHLPLGRNSPKPISGAAQMDDIIVMLAKAGASLPALAAYNHAQVFTNGAADKGGWGMGGNGPQDDGTIPATATAAENGAGDCAIAGPGREEMMEHKLSGNPGGVTFSCWRDIQNYMLFTGWATPGQAYDPTTGANDNGCDVATVLKYRQEVGLIDDQGVAHTIEQPIEMTPGDLQHAWLAGMLFQKFGFGMSFRQNNMDEFDANQPLTYVASSTDEGGHYFTSLGYVVDGGPMGRGAMWGESFQWRRALYLKQCEEASTYLTLAMFNAATGKDSDDRSQVDLEAFLDAFVQRNGIVADRPGLFQKTESFGRRLISDLEGSFAHGGIVGEPPHVERPDPEPAPAVDQVHPETGEALPPGTGEAPAPE